MSIKRNLLLAVAAFCFCLGTETWAQGDRIHGIPADVYYLMPSFCQGTVYLRGQPPAQGKLNICALDNTLRFLDNNGKELEASNNDEVVKVRIDTVLFFRYQNAFYRLHPLSSNLAIAIRRDVRILMDVKEGAYGTKSQTTSVKEYGMVYADGVAYNLNPDKAYPYTAADLLYIYNGDTILPFSRKGLRKLFPDRKDEIDAFFKSKPSLPETLEDAQTFLSRWAQ